MNNRPIQRDTSPNGVDAAGVTSTPRLPHSQNRIAMREQNPGATFDLSSFDPLQAHTLQLTASAGLINMLNPTTSAGAPSSPPSPGENSSSQQSTSKQQPEEPAEGRPQMTQIGPQIPLETPKQDHPQLHHCQNPYYFLQTSASSSVHPGESIETTKLSPSSRQGAMGQPAVPLPSVVAQPQNYILPASQSSALSAQSGFGQPTLFTGALRSTAAPSVLPNHLVMAQHFQNVAVGSSAQNQMQNSPVAALHPSKKRLIEEVSPASKLPPRELAPSIVSSAVLSTDPVGCGHPCFGDATARASPSAEGSTKELEQDIESMTPAERRRHERNLREQQRSYRISQQIKELREVLTESNVPFKPNKYSILLSVVDYIKQLQSRAIMLDAEHQKLIATIRQTNELVNSGNAPYSGTDETEETNTSENTGGSYSVGETDMLFVQGLDYRSLFEQCPAALGIAALDGRILECNAEFQILLGFAKEDLLKQSLFNLVRNHQDIFRAMAQMLKCAEESMSVGELIASLPPSNGRHWSGTVISKRNREVRSEALLLASSVQAC